MRGTIFATRAVRRGVATLLPLAACACGADTMRATGPGEVSKIEGAYVDVRFVAADSALASRMAVYADDEAPRIEAELGGVFGRRFTIEMFPDRQSLTTYWRVAWRQPQLVPECWMIASAGADTISLLTPRVWATSSCGPNASDETAVRRIVAHEGTHVLHRRLNGRAAFVSQDAWWFVEGLAVVVSGQLDDAARSRVRALAGAGRLPTRLADVLPAGYDVAGSLTSFVRDRWPPTAAPIVRTADSNELLETLGVDEPTLLREWARAVSGFGDTRRYGSANPRAED
jgi:hypothetical protein